MDLNGNLAQLKKEYEDQAAQHRRETRLYRRKMRESNQKALAAQRAAIRLARMIAQEDADA